MIIARGQFIKLEVPDYKIWFKPGGGGNWVSYLIWCWRNNTIIPGDHAHFSVPILSAVDPRYEPTLLMLAHDTVAVRADLVLGSNRAEHNRWYMNVAKNQVDLACLAYTPETPDYFNLDWADIVEDPENFLRVLNSLTGESIEFNSIVEQVWKQYLNSSYPAGVRGLEYLDNPMFDIVRKTIYNKETDVVNSSQLRIQQAIEIFDSRWIKCDPTTWAR